MKSVKSFLEEQSVYDKNRKITKLEGNVFGVPVRNRADFESCLKCVPDEMQSIISLQNLNRVPLDESYSVKTLTEKELQKYCVAREC